jgi:hypothetical protein
MRVWRRNTLLWAVGHLAMVLVIVGAAPAMVQAQCNYSSGGCGCQNGFPWCDCESITWYTDYCGNCYTRQAEYGELDSYLTPDPEEACDWFCGYQSWNQCTNDLWV